MYLSSIVKEWKRAEPVLVDAIADKLNINEVLEIIEELKPDLLVSLIGFETFQNDIESINLIKQKTRGLKVICFGYYPTIFPEEILRNSKIDIILRNEPELTFSQLYDHLLDKKMDILDIEGLAYRRANDEVIIGKPRNRINNLDALPFPDYSLIKLDRYNEPFLEKPFAVLQSSRGCPFNCVYCVRTYGRQLVSRSANNVLDELEKLIFENKIRSVRFMDDTFTVDKKRVIQICDGLSKRRLKIEWSCLSRVDTLDDEMASYMRQAGCIRVLLGIESGSQELLDYYGKGYTIEKIKITAKILKKRKIETVGWFIVGGYAESRENFIKTIRLAKKIKFDFVVASRLCLYPGVPLFEKARQDIDFSLFPYRNKFKDDKIEYESMSREKIFYRSFYFDPLCIIRTFRFFWSKPKKTILLAFAMIKFIIDKERDTLERKDLL